MRTHGLGGAARITRLDHAKNMVVPALLAGAERGFHVPRRAVERFQDIEVEMKQRIEHRGEHGLMRGGGQCEVKVDAPFGVLAALRRRALLRRLAQPGEILFGRTLSRAFGEPDLDQKPRFNQLAKQAAGRRAVEPDRGKQPLAGLAREECTDATAHLDEAHGLQALHGLAQGRATDRELPCELPFWRQAFANLQPAVHEGLLNFSHHRFRQRRRSTHRVHPARPNRGGQEIRPQQPMRRRETGQSTFAPAR